VWAANTNLTAITLASATGWSLSRNTFRNISRIADRTIPTTSPTEHWSDDNIQECGTPAAIGFSTSNPGIGQIVANFKMRIRDSAPTSATFGAITAERRDYGTYTPTLTGVANIDAVTPATTHFAKRGNIVHVWGTMSVDPTAAASTTTQVGISLPPDWPSNFTATADCVGTAQAHTLATTGSILADTVNDRAQLQFSSANLSAFTWAFVFSYEVK
jgi:hypothetical protein